MKDKKFPLIAEYIGDEGAFTVCFVNETEGIIVKSKNRMCEIVNFEHSWIPCFEKKYWRIIAQPSEYPKEMYVSGTSNEDAIQRKDKKMIVAYLEKHDRYICEDGYNWAFAVDTNAISEKQSQINDILAQINELQEKVNQLLSI
jgi:hypothetical protein